MAHTLKMDLSRNELLELLATIESMTGRRHEAMLEDVRSSLDSLSTNDLITVKVDWSDESVAALSFALLRRVDKTAAAGKAIEEANPGSFMKRHDWQDAKDEEMDSWGLLAQIAAYRRAAAEALLIQATD